jgi:hypothetical protein
MNSLATPAWLMKAHVPLRSWRILLAALCHLLVRPAAAAGIELAALPFEARIAVPPLLVLAVEGDPASPRSSWPRSYQPEFEYEGYFHHGLCYRYADGIFMPLEEADAAHYCGKQSWSGNFLNWAGMSARDTLHYALIGGVRARDSKQATVLQGTDIGDQGAAGFNKTLDARQADIARLTPFDLPQLFLRTCGGRLQVWRSAPEAACGERSERSQAMLTDLNFKVQVCGEQDLRPWLCKAYGRVSKPEGLLQAASPWLRLALMAPERKVWGGGLIGEHSFAADFTRQENAQPEWDLEIGVLAHGSTVVRRLSKVAQAADKEASDAKLLQALLQANPDLLLAGCQRNHLLRWPAANAKEQDGTTQLAQLRRQFARVQLDYQLSALPTQAELALARDRTLYIASSNPATQASTLGRSELETSATGNPRLPLHAQWQASVEVAEQRRLFTTGSGADSARLIALQATRLAASQLHALRDSPHTLRSDGLLMDRLAWLRGEAGVQESRGGMLANRSGSFAAQWRGNLAYLETAPGQGLVFMATADGLLHAIDSIHGHEVFAWLPSSLLGRVPAASAPDFPAQSLLDGGMNVGSMVQQGRSVPILALAAGYSARGVVALKLAEPAGVAGPGWRALEFSAADDARVGYVLQPPQIVRIASRRGNDRSGRPFLVFASGVNGEPGLFMLALDGTPGAPWVAGSNYFFFPSGAGKAGTVGHLAQPAVVLDDAQNLLHAWAGDERGRLWRFSLVEAAKAEPGFAFVATQVFTATDAAGEVQAITSAPRIAYAADKSYMVLFGSGQWLEINDAAPGSARQESFYGVLDRLGGAAKKRGDLTPRRVRASEAGFRVDGEKAATASLGWVLDFPVKGERVTQSALLLDGRVVFNSLLTPQKPCDALSYRNWELDALQGNSQTETGRTVRPGLQTPLVLRAPTAAVVNAFGRRPAGVASVFLNLPAAGAELEGSSKLKEAQPAGRLAWREIFNWSRLYETQRKP